MQRERYGTYVGAREVVNGGLRQHGVVLQLGLAKGRGVAGDDNELSLARSQTLEGRLVAESDCENVSEQISQPCFRFSKFAPLPDFITSARRELMLLASFLFFLGAILIY